MIQEKNYFHFQNLEEVNENSLFLRLDYDEYRKLSPPIITNYNIQENISEITTKKGKSKDQKVLECKYKKKKNSESQTLNSNNKSGHWGLQQNKRYHWFLEIYSSHFMNKHMRRMDKIFKTMANFIGTREAQQCRSHHQKMEKKYNSFCKIILNLRHNHYGTSDPTSIQNDISFLNLQLQRPILSQKQLQAQEVIYSPTSTNVQFPIVKTLELQEKKSLQENLQLMENQIQSDPIANLFNDQKYQNNLDPFYLF